MCTVIYQADGSKIEQGGSGSLLVQLGAEIGYLDTNTRPPEFKTGVVIKKHVYIDNKDIRVELTVESPGSAHANPPRERLEFEPPAEYR